MRGQTRKQAQKYKRRTKFEKNSSKKVKKTSKRNGNRKEYAKNNME